MTSRLKSALGALYHFSGALTAQEKLCHWAGRSTLAILLFHRVTDEIPEDGLTVSCARFRSLCRLLADRFHVVPLAEIFRLAKSGSALPARTLAITFDDCYRDNLDAAWILHEHDLPATFFVPTGFVGTDHVFAWDRGLKPMANLTWADVRQMHQLGFEIGSHTVTHPDLGTVSAERAAQELFESKATLEHFLDAPVRWFAYPFGGVKNFRAEWLALLKEAGYEGCLSGYGGFIHRGMENAVLPRVPVPSFTSNLQLEIHLSGCLNWYYTLKRCLGLSEVRQATWECAECAEGGLCEATAPAPEISESRLP